MLPSANKQDLLLKADQLEEMAKDETVRHVKFFDITGRIVKYSRYDLPYIADDLRRQAEAMAD